MVLSGPPTPGAGVQSVPPTLMRSNSGILGAQGGSSVPAQPAFPSLLSPRGQYNNMSLLSNISNVSSLLNQSFGSGGSNTGITGSGGGLQCGGMDVGGAESDPRSSVSNGMSFTPSATALVTPNTGNPSSAVQPQGQQFAKGSSCHRGPDQPQLKQLDAQNFQHGQQSLQQFPPPHNQPQQQQSHQQYQSLQGGLNNLAAVKLEPQMGNEQNGPQQQQSHQQYQSLRGGLSNFSAVKLEPQMGSEQNGPQQQQQPMQSLRNLGSVKMEAPHMQSLRSLGQVKMEPPHSEHSLYLQHQQQQQQLMHMSRQTTPVAAAAAQMTLLQQQRLLQLQQQQQQILKAIPQQRPQFQQQNLTSRPAVKPVVYEPGMGARRLTSYMYTQQHRPHDNNIEFWRKFVAEYFAPNARKRWCVSLYGSGRQTTGVFPQDVWHCEICNRKPGRGFETTVEVLPRLFKIKYDSGTMEELLYVDMPREYQNTAGQIVLDYAKAIQESVFEQLRVVRDGQLRIVFTSDLKICSWEFCARRHEELIPRRLIIPQVSQLGAVAQKYQAAAQNASSNLSSQEFHNTCDMFVASARQLAKAMEVPLVNDLGYTKRYVRCLQISEVVNSMKDLIDYSRQTGTGPMASLINFPRRTATSSGHHNQGQQSDDHQMVQNSNNNQNSIAASNNGVANANNSLNAASSSAGTIVGLLQNSMNSRQEHTMINANGLYGGGNSVQIPSASSSSAPTHPNPPSPFQSPSASASNNPPHTSHNALLSSSSTQLNSANSPANIPVQQTPQSNEADPNDLQCSVQQIIQDMMMSSQLNAGSSMIGMGSLGNEMKNINGMVQTGSTTLSGGGAGLVGNGIGCSGISSTGFSSMGGLGPSSAGGIRGAMANNSAALVGRVNMSSLAQDTSMNPQQQDLGTRLLSGLGAVDNFNSPQFDWKSSP